MYSIKKKDNFLNMVKMFFEFEKIYKLLKVLLYRGFRS